MDKYYLFFLLALVSEIIGTVSGFGSSILFVPVASFFFDFKTVLGVTAVFHVFSNLSKIFLFRKGIDKNIAVKLGVPAVLFVIAGALLTNYIPQKQISFMMDIVLIVLAVLLIYFFNKKLPANNTNLVAGGSISGFLAGLIGTGGAIRGLTMAAFNLEKEVFVATSALIDLGVDTSRAVIYIINGYFLWQHIYLIPFLIVISIAGSWIGKLILQRTSQLVFRYLVLAVIIITSAIQLVKYFRQ